MIPQDKIIEWGIKASVIEEIDLLPQNQWRQALLRELTAFANLVAQYQKEQDALACKRIAANPSSLWQEPGCWKHAAENCEAAIRGQE